MKRRTQIASRFYRGLFGQVMILLLLVTGPPQVLAWQESPVPPAQPAGQSAGQSQPVTEDVLPWQPGLGQPVAPDRAAAGGFPAPAIPLPAAQRLPAASTARPQSSARDAGTGPIPAADPANRAVDPANRAAIPAMQTPASRFPVVPSALMEGSDSESGPNAETTAPDIIDQRITMVTAGSDKLPNSAGQVWRTYDISPYTYMVKNTRRPQQAVIDWIIKETGTDMWFAEPLGILSASRNQLHVYHTPEIQNRIKPIIDRFVSARAVPRVMGLRLATIASPNWRSMALTLMQPVAIDAPGIEAWLMSKENAAILMGQLQNRADYQEHNNGDIVATDGQKYIISQTRPVEFVRSLAWVNQGAGYYQPVTDRIDVGYTVELSALGSLDGQSIEAIVGCRINQIEQLQPVPVQVPGAAGQTQTAELQIPQMVSWRANERFRWPSDQVLVLSCGVVATPGPQRQALLGIPALLNGTRGRADAIMFVEYKGQAAVPGNAARAAPVTAAQPVPTGPRR